MTPTEQLQPGMELHSDVLDASGRLLAKADTVLTEKHIKVLKTWGILHAQIKDGNEPEEPETETPPPSAEILALAAEQATGLFSHSNRQHPAMQVLYDISVQRIAIKLNSRKE